MRALEQQPAALVLACGFPCRELSRVNQNRQGLHAGETARFHEARIIFQALVNERDNQDDYDLGYEDYWCSDGPCGEDIGGAESKVSAKYQQVHGSWKVHLEKLRRTEQLKRGSIIMMKFHLLPISLPHICPLRQLSKAPTKSGHVSNHLIKGTCSHIGSDTMSLSMTCGPGHPHSSFHIRNECNRITFYFQPVVSPLSFQNKGNAAMGRVNYMLGFIFLYKE